MFGEGLGLIAGAVGITQGFPQARRVRALGHGAGVSLTTWMLMFCAHSSWVAYGIRVNALALVVSNALSWLMTGSVVVALTGRTSRTIIGLIGLATALMTLVHFLPLRVVSTGLIALTLSRVPQLIRSVRTVRNGQSSAVSLGSLSVTVCSLLLWGVYSVVQHRPLVQITTAIALGLTLAIVSLELRTRRLRQDATIGARC
jgi:uncharacterized protein with PQ loop repeat